MRGILDHISPFRNCQSYQFSAEQLMGLTEDLLILMTEVLAKNLPQIVHVTPHHIQEVSLLRRVAAGVKDQALDSKLLKRSDRSFQGLIFPEHPLGRVLLQDLFQFSPASLIRVFPRLQMDTSKIDLVAASQVLIDRMGSQNRSCIGHGAIQSYIELQKIPFQVFESLPAPTSAPPSGRALARAVGNLAQLSFNLLVTGVGVFYLLRDGPEIVGFLKDTSPLEPETTERLIDEVSSMVTASVQSNVITACAQGFCATLVFWILGLPGPIFWGVVSGILAFLPIIAPALVWGGAAIYLLVGGQIVKGIAMLVLGTFLISGVDNVIRPAVIAGRAKMNGFVALISLFGGIFFFGFLGIVLGPLLAAVTTGLLKSYRESALQAQAAVPTDS